MFPAVIFDYNGVLVDDEHVHLAAFKDALAPLGIDVSDTAYWERYIGFDDAGAFRAILEDTGQAPADADIRRLIETKRPLYLRRAQAELTFFEGGADLLRGCAATGPVGVVSGALRDEIDFGLGRLGVSDAVTVIVAAEDTAHGKPDPEGYRLGIARLAVHIGESAAQSAVAIEDSLAGIRAAKAAGLTCVAVGHSYAKDLLLAAGADLYADHIRSLDVRALEALSSELTR